MNGDSRHHRPGVHQHLKGFGGRGRCCPTATPASSQVATGHISGAVIVACVS